METAVNCDQTASLWGHLPNKWPSNPEVCSTACCQLFVPSGVLLMQESIFTSLVMLFTDNCDSRGAVLFLHKRKSIFSRLLALRDIHYACYLKPPACGTDVCPLWTLDPLNPGPSDLWSIEAGFASGPSDPTQLFRVQNSVNVCLKSIHNVQKV